MVVQMCANVLSIGFTIILLAVGIFMLVLIYQLFTYMKNAHEREEDRKRVDELEIDLDYYVLVSNKNNKLIYKKKKNISDILTTVEDVKCGPTFKYKRETKKYYHPKYNKKQ